MASFLVLGGCGFIGRNIVTHLVEDEACAKVVVCDKSRPELSWLTAKQKASFADKKVIFKQINLANEDAVSTFFSQHLCDYIINTAAETRLKMPECSYEVNIYKLGMIAAKEAAKMKAKKFIQITSARIKIIEENRNRQDSVTEILECEKRLEDDLKSISGPSLVYGSGDKHGLSFTLMPLISAPMIILMSIYKKLKEPLVLLWEPTIPVSTVHVHDVVSACLFCTKIENSGDIFELCDESESTQGSLAAIVGSIFGVSYKFLTKFKNMLAKTFFEDVVSEINCKHMKPWSKACEEEGIDSTPLIPYFSEEQLILDNFSVDNKPLKDRGFVYMFPTLQENELRKIIDEYVSQSLFPKSCAP